MRRQEEVGGTQITVVDTSRWYKEITHKPKNMENPQVSERYSSGDTRSMHEPPHCE